MNENKEFPPFSDGQTHDVFSSNGPSCLLMMVHSVSDAVNSVEGRRRVPLLHSYAVQLL